MRKEILNTNIENFGVLNAIELLIKRGLINAEKGKAFLTERGSLVALKVSEAIDIFEATDDESIVDLAIMSELDALIP